MSFCLPVCMSVCLFVCLCIYLCIFIHYSLFIQLAFKLLFSLAASSYDLRFSIDMKQLRYSFENASVLNDNDIILGNLSSPYAATEKEVFVIRFPSGYNHKTLYFGLKVNHSIDRISDLSNVASAAIVYVPPKSPPTTTSEVEPTTGPDDTTTTMEQEPELSHNSAEAQLVIKLALGSALPVTFLIIVMVGIKLTCSRKTRNSGGQEENGPREHHLTQGNTSRYHNVLFNSSSQHVCCRISKCCKCEAGIPSSHESLSAAARILEHVN